MRPTLFQKETARGYQPDEMSQWFLSDADDVKGVILIIHGLNQKPSKWMDMIQFLNTKNFHVFRLTLKGHGGARFKDMMQVDADTWLEDIDAATTEIQQKFPKTKKILLAYSLGALSALEYQLKTGKQVFQKQLLLAPAIRLKDYVFLVKPLIRIFPSIPSRSPEEYRANPFRTASAAYQAMFSLLNDFSHRDGFSHINSDTLVLMRTSDELVSYAGIKDWIETTGMTRWQIKEIPDAQSGPGRQFRHLILDRDSFGQKGWTYVKKQIEALLLD